MALRTYYFLTTILFNICNVAILLFWFLIIFFPKFSFTKKIIEFPWVPIFLGFFYSYFVFISGGISNADFSSLDGIIQLFKKTSPESAAAGWIHYLAFDFLVACWIIRNSQKNNIAHLVIIIPLLATFVLGPIGLITYGIIYLFKRLKD